MESCVSIIISAIIGTFIGHGIFDIYKTHKTHKGNEKMRSMQSGEDRDYLGKGGGIDVGCKERMDRASKAGCKIRG